MIDCYPLNKMIIFNLSFSVFLFISQAGVFMGFSITSAVLGGLIIICYSISIAMQRPYNRRYYESLRYRNYDEEMAISAIILILGIIEFAIGIWAAVCVCFMNICYFSTPPQQVNRTYESPFKTLRNNSV